MFIDDEAVEMTAEKLHLTTDEVRSAVKVSIKYNSVLKSLKAKRQLQRAQTEQMNRIVQFEREHPDWCSCDERGVSRGQFNMNSLEIVGHETFERGVNPCSNEPSTWPIYKCPRCGKKWLPLPAYA